MGCGDGHVILSRVQGSKQREAKPLSRLSFSLAALRAAASLHATMGKGVSAQEKRDRMLAMFHKACAPFTKKDVEKCAPKEGIISGAVEGVLKELCGDDLVREGKIGGSLFYWAFPGEARSRKRGEVDKAHAQLARQEEQVVALRAQAEEARKASGQSESDAARIKETEEAIALYRKREADAGQEMTRVKKSGSQNMALRRKDVPILRDAANRWTDNSFELRKYMVEQCNCDPAQADGMLGTDKIDYVD